MNTFTLTTSDIYKPATATLNTIPNMGGLQSILNNNLNNWGQPSDEDVEDAFMLDDDEDFEID